MLACRLNLEEKGHNLATTNVKHGRLLIYTDVLLADFWGPASNFGIPVAAVMDTQKSPELCVCLVPWLPTFNISLDLSMLLRSSRPPVMNFYPSDRIRAMPPSITPSDSSSFTHSPTYLP